jgi:hypothetical protein
VVVARGFGRSQVGPWLGALVALAAGVGGRGAVAAEPLPTRLDLVWVDLAETDPTLLTGMGAAAEDLLAPLGIQVTSRVELPRFGFRGGTAIVILSRSNPNPAHAGRPVAGAVVAERTGSHGVWVFPPTVARGLGLALERVPQWSDRQRREFAHAVAVVVAHELAHSLAGVGHAPDGLMAETLGSRQLRDRQLWMEDWLASRFRSALATSAGLAP